MGIIKNYQSNKGTCKVTFSYPAVDGVEVVQVLGDFNKWDSSQAPTMKKVKDTFSTNIELSAGATYEFRYLINEAKWDNDHNADKYVPSPFNGINNSVIILDEVVKSAKTAPSKKVSPSTVKATSTTKKATKPVAEKAVKLVATKVTTKDVAAVKAKTTETKIAASKVAVKNTPQPKAVKPVVKATETKVVAPKAVKPTSPKVKTVKPEAKMAKPTTDDLKKIEGIGPKIALLLNAKSIYTFAELSKAKVETLKNILDEAGSKFKMHNPASWPKQADLAAKGNWDALKKLQDELIGGVK